MRARKKQFSTDKNVYEAALERIEYCYKRFDQIVVSFSGGKDSTAVLNLTIEVARRLGKLPVRVVFFDEEAIHPPTIEYVQRVAQRTEVALEWYCLPIKHRNACSNEQPYWYCWNPDEKEKWVRPMPDGAITTHPEFKFGMQWQEFADYMDTPERGNVCRLTGVRTQESLRRFKAVATKKNDAYIAGASGHGNTFNVHPIYDWSSEDVWVLVKQQNLDYNRTYDIFNRTRWNNRLLAMRVCPPFGEEPLRGLWMYAECFPELWHKMLYRVPGVATAWRYHNTELYGIGPMQKPDGITWQQYLEIVYANYDEPETLGKVKAGVNSIRRRHYSKTDDAIPDEEVHPLTGTSWKFLCKVATKGDLKNRTAPQLENAAITAQRKLGINSYEEAKRLFGKKSKK